MNQNSFASGESLIIRNMRSSEADIAFRCAADEGWNPGLYDIGCHYAVDPKGWFVAEYNGSVAGIVMMSNYDEKFSFGGFLVVLPEFRNHGIADALINKAFLHTEGRICGIDGVFEMQETYSRKYGFLYAYRNIRWEGEIKGELHHNFLKAENVPFEKLLEYDTRHFFTERRTFLEKWINQKDSICLVSCEGDEITGYGMIRRCVAGHKIGPLFAEKSLIAEKLFLSLCGYVNHGPIYLDTPEPNADAVALAKKYNMREVFGTARMYTRKIPKLPLDNIFGVTSFEMG
ncbi:MAG: GNAT family N-acetyltransferase [Methanomicrobium sp.]|nr:GNAT family N-acetyltransferase [Methanomicrobium sp.]